MKRSSVLKIASATLVVAFLSPTAASLAGAADTTPPDTSVPDTSAPDTSAPDTSAPDTSAPDTTPPDTSAPDTSVPDTSAPDTSAPATTAPSTTPPSTAVVVPNKRARHAVESLEKLSKNTAKKVARALSDRAKKDDIRSAQKLVTKLKRQAIFVRRLAIVTDSQALFARIDAVDAKVAAWQVQLADALVKRRVRPTPPTTVLPPSTASTPFRPHLAPPTTVKHGGYPSH